MSTTVKNWKEVTPEAEVEIRLALLGDPVEHSLSAVMQNAALRALEVSASYEAFRVSREEFPVCVEHLFRCGFLGVNVTSPHKRAAAILGRSHDSATRMIQAANVLRFEAWGIASRNTDVPGFLKPISDLPPGKALVLGAGDAGAASAYGLLRLGWRVRVYNRTGARAQRLAWSLGMWGDIMALSEPDPRGCDLVVNATSLGREESPEGSPPLVPLIWENLKPEAVVYDMVYGWDLTAFLKKARSLGHRVIDGREMLVEQGALSLEWWLGRPAPREVMRQAVGL
ncbi:MAG: shikimate dehydrogenase [Fimbriimonadales bacterium]|nr:shikimate dehydrogenase [Fimbriimonadales bacterium]